jgi:hypothetical protein
LQSFIGIRLLLQAGKAEGGVDAIQSVGQCLGLVGDLFALRRRRVVVA